MRRIAVVFLSFLVAACAGSGMGGISRSYEFSPNTTKGIVFLSTTFEIEGDSDCGPGVSMFTVGREGGNPVTNKPVLLRNFLVPPFFKDPDGYFIVLELPENEYVFKRLQYGNYYVSPMPVDIRFRVSAGEVHYLGQVNVTVLTCYTNQISIDDRRDRDVPVFAREMKNFDSDAVKYQILKIKPIMPE